mgnify:CR=1 FL=1
MATFLSADLLFLSLFPLVFTVTANTNDSQEKNDKSLEKTIATAGKNENLLPWRKAFDQGDR